MSTVEADRAEPLARTGHRFLVVRLHFYAGLLVGPFLLIAALTGGLYAVAPSIESWMYRDQLHTANRGPALPLADQVRAAQDVRPDLVVSAVRPAERPSDTTRVMFTDPMLGESETRAVFIDPVTGASTGELTVYGSSGALPVRTWLDNLHRSLHLGEPGRLYSELAASWLWVIALGGLWMWIRRYRRMRAQGSARARLLTVERTAKGRRRTLNRHGVVGIWIAVGLLFLSATGLTWSTYAGANVDKLRAALSWTTPSVSTELVPGGSTPMAGEHAGHHHPMTAAPAVAPSGTPIADLDRVLAAARDAGLDGPVQIGIPAEATTAFTVAQTRQPWVLSNNAVAVDGATGTLTDVSWFADWPLAAKLSAWGIQLHMGTLFGLANQVVLLALAVALVVLIVYGYRMWWQRRPTRCGFGRPPGRGALAAMGSAPAVATLLVAAGIGWFIPLLGISLAAFLAVDVLIGQYRRRRGVRLDIPTATR
ncbi:putative integral membrane protein [Mycolicibacterium insubricum]|uniref:Peptidase n=1 Tax=Mycolicibacterium insubricum TaxID=444597 RepID=A0A1X0DP13_9MYCO|nr:PepSY domain-containing protein [Mycolicibacterium insubricum]MCV7083247.1 PepSY domain-containing protein [Mycolicibacterium insubricum]ORA74128.1 peptidase [Mycolicibacterium insubricum]BBZ67834.1 putative integral membrane protein [Mycolicibacterium insubricum]